MSRDELLVVLADELGQVADRLRSGMSLREALSAADGPLAPLAGVLRSRTSLVVVLDRAVRRATVPELASALAVLGVHARVGGDPVEAITALAERLRERAAAARDARALTAQARASARTILGLSPAFLALLLALDPTGTWSALSSGPGRVAVGAGSVLQVAGALWISRLVGVIGRGRSRLKAIPVLRVFVAGRRTSDGEADQVAQAAETLAFVIEAGLSPGQALEVVAPTVGGPFGSSLRAAVGRIRAGEPFSDAVAAIPGRAASRLAGVLGSQLGVPMAERLRSLARELRRAEATRLAEEVRRMSVRVLFPLGLLLLPAFVLICLVPLFGGGLRGLSP